jgi:hypothetical protein
MPPRRRYRWEDPVGSDGEIRVRWETEQDVVQFTVLLLARVEGAWRPVVLFDCSHDDRNDRHRYSFDGLKGPAETFLHGTPGHARCHRLDHDESREDDRAMAPVRTSRRTPAREAASRVMMEDIDRVIAGGESRFPYDSCFIGSDLVTDEMVRERHEVGKTVVIVDEHEHVTVLPAPDPSLGERESERFWSRILTHW